MRIKHTVNVNIALDTDMNNILFGINKTLAEAIYDEYDKQASGTINIAQSLSEDLDFGDVDNVKGVYIKVDQDCIIKLNNGNEEINIVKGVSTTYDFAQFFMEAALTNVNITAPADEDLTGIYCVWGD